MPFYGGWGLTQDFVERPDRRTAKPSKMALIHAALIDYPYYWDPITDDPCPPEVLIERFLSNRIPKGKGPALKIGAKIQGAFASQSPLWRRR
jgi:capsular polysaccharide export protein